MSQDPRGPMRKAIKIDERADVTLVTLDCGHVGQFNQIFHYRLGDLHHCVKCLGTPARPA